MRGAFGRKSGVEGDKDESSRFDLLLVAVFAEKRRTRDAAVSTESVYHLLKRCTRSVTRVGFNVRLLLAGRQGLLRFQKRTDSSSGDSQWFCELTERGRKRAESYLSTSDTPARTQVPVEWDERTSV